MSFIRLLVSLQLRAHSSSCCRATPNRDCPGGSDVGGLSRYWNWVNISASNSVHNWRSRETVGPGASSVSSIVKLGVVYVGLQGKRECLKKNGRKVEKLGKKVNVEKDEGIVEKERPDIGMPLLRYSGLGRQEQLDLHCRCNTVKGGNLAVGEPML